MDALSELKAEDFEFAIQLVVNRHPGLLQPNSEEMDIDLEPLDSLTLRQLAAFARCCLRGCSPEAPTCWPGLLFGSGALATGSAFAHGWPFPVNQTPAGHSSPPRHCHARFRLVMDLQVCQASCHQRPSACDPFLHLTKALQCPARLLRHRQRRLVCLRHPTRLRSPLVPARPGSLPPLQKPNPPQLPQQRGQTNLVG